MLAGFFVRMLGSIGNHGRIGFPLPDHRRSIDLLEDMKWAEVIIILLGKCNGPSCKWDGWNNFSKRM